MMTDFGTAARKRLAANLAGVGRNDTPGKPDKSSVDAAWLVLEAANDLGDHATVEACRRVIDADLNGTVAARSDIDLVLDYFR